MILSLDRRINEEIEEKKKLNETLQITLKEQTKFHEVEKQLKDRIRYSLMLIFFHTFAVKLIKNKTIFTFKAGCIICLCYRYAIINLNY